MSELGIINILPEIVIIFALFVFKGRGSETIVLKSDQSAPDP
jgi:hypothetical protein